MTGVCPLCENEKSFRRSRKRLYGHLVCAKCANRFASRRRLAWIIDVLCLWLTTFPIGVLLGIELMVIGAALRMDLETIWEKAFQVLEAPLAIVLTVLFNFKDGFSGRSPGKVLCGVQVLDVDTGAPIGYRGSFNRNLCLLIPLMPIIVAVELAKGPRTGDQWARTMVVWKKYAGNPVFAIGAPVADQTPPSPPQDAAAAGTIEPTADPGTSDQAPGG